MEKKIIESVNECDVPSLEDIKKRIDFSKNPPVKREKVFFSKKLACACCIVIFILSMAFSLVVGFNLMDKKYSAEIGRAHV